MTSMRAPFLPVIALAALSLSACNRSQDAEVAKLDNQIIGNDTDPALTSALEDQIMVDPSLTQQSNRNAARAQAGPAQAQYPLPATGAQQKSPASAAASAPAGGAAPQQAAQASGGASTVADCAPKLKHNAGWARRLPAPFAVLPGARITDAAGAETAECRARVVTFTTNAPPQRVLDHYRSRAAGAGYSAEHQMREGDHILAGTAGGAAYYLIVTPVRAGGSDVALITNGG